MDVDSPDQLYFSLMKWLRNFPVSVKGTEENISEGVSMAQVKKDIFLYKRVLRIRLIV